MIVLGLEQFSARRRSAQERIENGIRPVVERALDGTVNTDGYSELIQEVRDQWRTAYADEAGSIRGHIPGEFIEQVRETLAKTDRTASDHNTVDRITVWLATAILSHATVTASGDDPEELFLEWVDMGDSKVRHTHEVANGQQVPIGESFTVGGQKMPYPGYPGVDIELWINCRCTVRPVLASEALVAAIEHAKQMNLNPVAFKDYTDKERKDAHTLPGGGFPIENCADLRNAIQAIGRAKDPAKAKAHIRSRKSALGCPDVKLPESWAVDLGVDLFAIRTPEQIAAFQGEFDWIPKAMAEHRPQREPLDDPIDPEETTDEPTHAGLGVQAADTGRILLIQRALDPDDAPEVQGTWEFPGGSIDPGESPEEAARREFTEETGCLVPDGEITGGWRSEDGVYQGFVLTVDIEREAVDLNPDKAAVQNPDDPKRNKAEVCSWFSIEQIANLGAALRPEVHNTDWSQFSEGGGDHAYTEPDAEEEPMPEDEIESQVAAADEATTETPDNVVEADFGPPTVRGHGVLTVEGEWSGDKRRFSAGAIRTRPLPLPLGWQRSSASGHDASVTVFKVEQAMRVGDEIRYDGHFIDNPESGEVQGLIAEFGRFGVSIDADDVTMATEEDEQGLTFTDARSCGGSIVAIPAFHRAYITLGPPEDGFYEGGEPLDQGGESMVASIEAADISPGKTEDGPGWLTNYIPTDRLRDWWASQESGVNWGVSGDFNRCRAKAAQYIKPQYLAGFCANRHYDALGFWPGQEASMADTIEGAEPSEALSLVAAQYGNIKAPADWFSMPEPDLPCPLTITEDGQVFGHVATWKQKHANTAAYGADRKPPHSSSGYREFLLGGVLLDSGETVPAGCLTIGAGHAKGHLRLRDAQRHYDDATTAFADVTVTDGKVGIWACGWVRPGTPEEMVVAARASKLSGDWRKDAFGNWEMIAALAVNAPGYSIPRVASGFSSGEQVSLVAANVVESNTFSVPTDFDYDAFANAVSYAVMERMEAREKMAALRQREFGKVEV